jgi:hypothetical protein
VLLRRRLLIVCLGLFPSMSLVEPGCSRVRSERCPISEEALAHPKPPPGADVKVVATRKKAWENALGGAAAAQPYIRARLVGWPQRVLVKPETRATTDREFVRRVAGDTWRGLQALTDRENGLPIDNVRFTKETVDIAQAHIGDYASGTDIGLYLVAIVAAHALDLISEADASERIRRILNTLEHLETYRGFLFNFYDTTSLEPTSNFVSFVDAAWLSAGLMVVRMALPALYDQCSKLITSMDFGFFYNAWSRQISHGYYVRPGVRSPYSYGTLYTEARVGSLIAIGKGEVPPEQWFAMRRTFPAACAWQPVRPTAVRRKTVAGHTFSAGYDEWRGVRYVPSWGGSMFEALMPLLLLDEPRYAAKSLGANDHAHAAVQRRWALEELGYPVWGISPCSAPSADRYGEYGVKVLGARGYDAGAVSPHASALAVPVSPEAAIANLRTLAERYDVYGEYGFYDAVDPRTGTVAYTYLSLDQSMLFIALANDLDDNYVQKRFAADPIIQNVLPLIGEEDFFD